MSATAPDVQLQVPGGGVDAEPRELLLQSRTPQLQQLATQAIQRRERGQQAPLETETGVGRQRPFRLLRAEADDVAGEVVHAAREQPQVIAREVRDRVRRALAAIRAQLAGTSTPLRER